MGTKKIGGSGRDISWDQFDVRGFSNVELEGTGDSAHIELEGISSYSDSGTITTGVIDLKGGSDTISWDETLPGATDLTVTARFLNIQPLESITGNNWNNFELPSNFDGNWGYHWNSPSLISEIPAPYSVTQILSNYNCLIPDLGSESYLVALTNHPDGYFAFSDDSGITWTLSSSIKSYFAGLSIYTGSIELLTGTLTRYSSGSVIVLAKTQLLGLRIYISSNATGTEWIDVTDDVTDELGASLTRNTLLGCYIKATAAYTNIMVARSLNGIGYILEDSSGATWTKVFESTKLSNPISIHFRNPQFSGNLYIGSIYESDRGWKSAYFKGTIDISGNTIWEEIQYDGQNHVCSTKGGTSCGIGVMLIDGQDTVVGISAAGALFNLTNNSHLETMEGLSGGRIAISYNRTHAIIYSTYISDLSKSFLFEPNHLNTQASESHSLDGITSVLQVSDFYLGENPNWIMLGTDNTITKGLFSWSLRNPFVEFTNGESISNSGRFAQFQITLIGG